MSQDTLSLHYRKPLKREGFFGVMNISHVFIFFVFLFLFSTLFDPADKVFGLKLPLYLSCWGLGLVVCLAARREIKIPYMLLIYVSLMVGIPAISIVYYYSSNGSDPNKCFELFKAYLFISFSFLLYITRINILKYLCGALTVLAALILILAAIVLTFPELYAPSYLLGEELGIFSIDKGRDYGSDVVMFQMYFVTSPMLAISISYYFDLAKTSMKNRGFFAVLTLFHICAMIVAGSRNNILAAIILPIALFVMYSKNKMRSAILIALLTGFLVIIWFNEISAIFDPSETSNSSKLIMLKDYMSILSNPIKLFFGSGLGAYEHWTDKGYTYITELTYLEVIRNFGLLLGGLMILLLIYPILYAFILRPNFKEKKIILGYAAYLVMCISNPNLFSSMGMMFLAIIMVKIATYEVDARRLGYQ